MNRFLRLNLADQRLLALPMRSAPSAAPACVAEQAVDAAHFARF